MLRRQGPRWVNVAPFFNVQGVVGLQMFIKIRTAPDREFMIKPVPSARARTR